MQALLLIAVVLAAAVMWVGVILTMLTGLHRAERRVHGEVHEPVLEKDPEQSEAPSRGRA